MTPQPTTLIGIALPHKTSNVNEQAMADCGQLWQRFEQEGIFNTIPGKTAFEIYAVYHDYDGDHTQPYAYFIGCPVAEGTEVPEGLQKLEIPAQEYTHIVAKGKMPTCVADAWRDIWQADHNRAYGFDFEIYGAKAADWNDAEVDIYLSVK